MRQVDTKRIIASASIVAFAICTLLPLAACAPILGLAGSTNPLVQALATQLDQFKLLADAVSYTATRKTVSDHVVSRVVGGDCRLFNVASGAAVCSSVTTHSPSRVESTSAEYISTKTGGGFAEQSIDPTANVPGARQLTNLERTVERTDCKTGTEYWHARIAFEARGGQVTSFAYYSIGRPRTCSLDFERGAPGTKWSRTPEGDTRVDTAHGRFVIRSRPDSYVFEFTQVQRQKFCGMPGEINGSMIVTRGTGTPECLAIGMLDTDHQLLERRLQSKATATR
jgi:hypothetical protein